MVSAQRLMAHLKEVSKGDRISGSEDEARCLDYMQRTLGALGYATRMEAPETLIGFPVSSRLEVLAPEPFEVVCKGHALAPSTPGDGVEGELVFVGAGQPADYPPAGLDGRIALSEGLAGPDKSLTVDASGALAQIHINDDHIHDGIISPVWGSPGPEDGALLPKTPAVSIVRADGENLRRLLATGPVRIRLRSETYLDWRPTPILSAELPGTQEDLFVIFSAHADSWGEGAMDNGSGNAVQLEVARLLAERRTELRRGIRIIAWSGHSHGRYSGSAWYADNHYLELKDRCACHVNADAVGAVGADNLSLAPTLAETYEFGRQIVKEMSGQDLTYRRMPSRMSEQSFLHLGVPSCFATLSEQAEGGFGWWIHTPEDTLDKVSEENLLRDARIYMATVWDLCTSPLLPFDFAAAAREMGDVLRKLQDRHAARLDLSPLVEAAEQLAVRIDDFGRRPVHDAGERNRRLLELGHCLIPVNYSRSGPFHQDPALSPHPVLPGLAGLEQLADSPAGSWQARMWLVELTRQRNRTAVALAEAQRVLALATS
jgi:Peptidase family M28